MAPVYGAKKEAFQTDRPSTQFKVVELYKIRNQYSKYKYTLPVDARCNRICSEAERAKRISLSPSPCHAG